MRKKKIKFEEGSGNVFADLGLKDSDELFARAQIGLCVHIIVNDKNLKQREIGAVLGMGFRGHNTNFLLTEGIWLD
jgi:predicted XRE-type DNA-binding protein